jgi:hypothetical protein
MEAAIFIIELGIRYLALALLGLNKMTLFIESFEAQSLNGICLPRVACGYD